MFLMCQKIILPAVFWIVSAQLSSGMLYDQRMLPRSGLMPTFGRPTISSSRRVAFELSAMLRW